MYQICKNIAIAYSPILCFTCEEIYNSLEILSRKESIALEDYPVLGEIDLQLEKEYQTLLALRGHINTALEPLRKGQVIGSSSEASVEYLPVLEEEKELINKLGEGEVARACILSSFSLASETKVEKHNGHRCDRCWNYFEEVEDDSEGNHLCHRCSNAVKHFVMEHPEHE